MPECCRYHLETANLASYEDRFRQLYWRIIWTHKIHEKQADIYSAERRRVDVSAMSLTAVSGCGILAAGWLSSPPYNVIPIVIAAISIFLDIKSHVTDYGTMIVEQRISAERFLSLREEALNLIAAAHDGSLDASKASTELACFELKYEQACNESPRTTPSAVSQAEKALANGDGMATDEAIDRYLPESLRRSQ